VAVKASVMTLRNAHTLRKASARRTPTTGPEGDIERGPSGAKSVTGLAFALNDTILVSSGADGRIKYWDVRKVSHLNPAGVRLEPRHVVVFDVKPVAGAGPAWPSTRPHGITCIALSPGGNRLAAYSLDNHIYEYDFYAPEDVAAVRRFDAPVSSFYARAAYAPTGRHLVSGSSSERVCVYDTHSPDAATAAGAMPLSRLEGHAQSVLAVDWSPFDNQIVSCSDDGTTRLWTVQPSRPQVKRRRVQLEEGDASQPDAAVAVPATPAGPAPQPLSAAAVAAAAPVRRDPVQRSIMAFFTT
jgi:WD40 repeat protein